MVSTEAMNNNRIAGEKKIASKIASHLTMFTLQLKLSVMCEQRWIQFELHDYHAMMIFPLPAEFLHLMAKYTLPFSKPQP